jgi:hypothetical protein
MVEESAWTNEEQMRISAADNPQRGDYYKSRTDIHPTVAGCERGKAEMMRR